MEEGEFKETVLEPVLTPLRFSEIESVTFLAHLMLKYKFTGTPVSENETQDEMKERLLKWHLGTVTLSPEKVPLTFTLRS